jgi:hypothetical protein
MDIVKNRIFLIKIKPKTLIKMSYKWRILRTLLKKKLNKTGKNPSKTKNGRSLLANPRLLWMI